MRRASIQTPAVAANTATRILPANPARRYLRISSSSVTPFYVYFGDPGPVTSLAVPGIRVLDNKPNFEAQIADIGDLIKLPVWISWPSGTPSNVALIEGYD